jgi:hypothetical protein
LEGRFEFFDDAEVLVPTKLAIEDMKFLLYEPHASEAKHAVRAVFTEDQIGALGDVVRVYTVARGVTSFAAPTMCTLDAARALMTVGAEETIDACRGKHALKTSRAVVGLVGAGVVLGAGRVLAKFTEFSLELSLGQRDITHVALSD